MKQAITLEYCKEFARKNIGPLATTKSSKLAFFPSKKMAVLRAVPAPIKSNPNKKLPLMQIENRPSYNLYRKYSKDHAQKYPQKPRVPQFSPKNYSDTFFNEDTFAGLAASAEEKCSQLLEPLRSVLN